MDGKTSIGVWTSKDDCRTVQDFQAPIQLPLAKGFYSVRGLVELEDGRIFLTMYGNMEGDRVWAESPVSAEAIHKNTWFRNRVICVESKDRGRSWQYLDTVSYHPELTPMGQNESDIALLPNGQLFAAMRTGIHGYRDHHGRSHLDQPLLVAWSADGGRVWTDPQRVYVDGKLITGIYPRILVTAEGVLAVLRTRVNGSVIFSPDGQGATWSDEVIHYSYAEHPDHACMQDMALIGPNTILVIDVLKNGGWHAQGVPITVKKK